MKVGTFLFIASCLVGRWLPFALAYGMTTSRVVGHCYRAVFDCAVEYLSGSRRIYICWNSLLAVTLA